MKVEKYFTKKIIIFTIVTLLLVSSVTAINIKSNNNTPPPANTSRNIIWNTTLYFTETGGRNDYITFGESPNATDGVDVFYDKSNPPSGPDPFLDAYFTTNFPGPYNALMQEIKEYPDTYKEWNFTVWWTGSDTTVTITWNITDFDESEYSAVILYHNIGVSSTDMLATNNYEFFCPGSGLVSFQIIATANRPPITSNPYPENESTGVERPPDELNVTVEDPDDNTMDVHIRWKRHDYYHFGEFVTLQTYNGVGNAVYNFTIPLGNNWIWGNTTYNWSINVTDGTHWTNETYQYTTGGSRYDVNNNDRVNFQDAGLVWIHRTSEVAYDGIYDVNQNGEVNFQDAGLTWINRD